MRTVDFAFFSQIAYFDWYKINECGEFYFKNQIDKLKIDTISKMKKIVKIKEEIKKLENIGPSSYCRIAFKKNDLEKEIEKNKNLIEQYEKEIEKNKNFVEQYKKEINNRLENPKKFLNESEVLNLIEKKSDILGIKKDEEIVDGIKLYGFEDKRLYAVYSEDSVTQKPKFSFEGWKFCEGYDHKSDLQMALFRKNDNYMIAIRGTEQSSTKDIITDIFLTLSILPKQVKELINTYENIKKKLEAKIKIFITGHSLGGWLAEFLYLYTEKKYKTVTFNGFGLNKKHLEYMNGSLDGGETNSIVDIFGESVNIVRAIPNTTFSITNKLLEKLILNYENFPKEECISYINDYDGVGNANMHIMKEYRVLSQKNTQEIDFYKRAKKAKVNFQYHGVNDFIQFMDNDGNITKCELNKTFKANYLKYIYDWLAKNKKFFVIVNSEDGRKIIINNEEYKWKAIDNINLDKICFFKRNIYNENGGGKNYEKIYLEKTEDNISFIKIKRLENIVKEIGSEYIGYYKIGKFNNIKKIEISKNEFIYGGLPYIVFIRKKSEIINNVGVNLVLNGQKLKCKFGDKNPEIVVKGWSKLVDHRLVVTTRDKNIEKFGYCHKQNKECDIELEKCFWQKSSHLKKIFTYDFLLEDSYYICNKCEEKIEIIPEKINIKAR